VPLSPLRKVSQKIVSKVKSRRVGRPLEKIQAVCLSFLKLANDSLQPLSPYPLPSLHPGQSIRQACRPQMRVPRQHLQRLVPGNGCDFHDIQVRKLEKWLVASCRRSWERRFSSFDFLHAYFIDAVICKGRGRQDNPTLRRNSLDCPRVFLDTNLAV